ncbi:MAG: IS200/IS605 family transposase [Chloroflexota bacterium]|nr:IS200/IS605 family transposase [Chloroflexota bacterium]
MRAPYTQLYLHCVWATWDRLPLISPELEQPIYAAILSKVKKLKCVPIAIGGMSDHIHLLTRLHTTVAVADLMKEVKGSSSHLVTHQIEPGEFFKWQGAYGAFTISKGMLDKVRKYIENQKQHHSDDDLWTEFELTMEADD